MLRLMRSRTYRQLLTQIQDLHDRASSQKRGRLTAEYRITKALDLLRDQDTGPSPRLTVALTSDSQFTAALAAMG
ncbi:hypothetical protein [Streptomyces hydrogenans]|uniref:hypothetical protein n=1 Tax=Streptomyces hydrogenans TaxID=1873719 RepID=UPI00381A3E81